MHIAFSILLGAGFWAVPSLAWAHAFGQSFTLPIPLWIYLYGGGAAVALSFVIIGYFLRESATNTERTLDLSRFALVRFFVSKPVKAFVRLVSVVLFITVILGGFLGSPANINQNFTIVFFWIIVLLGITYLCILVGDLWRVVNPVRIIVKWLMRISGQEGQTFWNYPRWLGYAPALVFYMLLIWLELVGEGIGTQPIFLAIILLNYVMVMYVGSIFFGREAWFCHADFFSVFFGLVSKVSPIQASEGRIVLRSPWRALLQERVEHMSLLFFILFMLSSTAFDGFSETRSWWNLYFKLSPVASQSHISPNTLSTIALLASPVLFFILYFIAVRFMKTLTSIAASTRELLLAFAFSLIPIAVAYNVAHYFTLLLIQGQGIIPAISDPLSLGWDLFGTADYTVNVGLISASTVWHLQVAFILLGHILAVYVAHRMALKVFATHRQALVSQLPMLLLMVFYTLLGLWILAQPIATGA